MHAIVSRIASCSRPPIAVSTIGMKRNDAGDHQFDVGIARVPQLVGQRLAFRIGKATLDLLGARAVGVAVPPRRHRCPSNLGHLIRLRRTGTGDGAPNDTLNIVHRHH